MFPEQPAPSQPVSHVQTQQADTTAPQPISPTLAQPNLAKPESLSPSLPSSQIAPPSQSIVNPAAAAEATPAASSSLEAAKAQRRIEVERALLQITSKARAQRQEQQIQEAAQNSAKYGGSGEYDQARHAINKPAIPAQIRAALLKKLDAKQVAQTGKSSPVAIAKKLGTPQTPNPVSRSSSTASSGYAPPPTGYSTQALLPSNQIALQLPISQLFGKTGLSLILPLTIPAEITSAFGWRTHPITGEARFHRGIDLGAPYGSPIVAAKSGQVYLADAYGGYGLTVILQHNAMQQTLYAHMSQFFVKQGEWVKQGQIIGQVGSTGFSTGPHLHFEFLQQTAQGWTALDPAMVFEQAIASIRLKQTQIIAQGIGNTVNLSASGIVDISAVAPTVASQLHEDLLTSLLEPVSIPAINRLLPFTLSPQAATAEFGWLSPFINSLFTAQFDPTLPLSGFVESQEATRFQAIAALKNSLQAPPTAPSPTAFESGTLQVATVKPFANLTIAATMPGIVNLEALRQPERSTQQLAALKSRSRTKTSPTLFTAQKSARLEPLKLSDNRRSTILPSKLPLQPAATP